jgi:hypothetical protein
VPQPPAEAPIGSSWSQIQAHNEIAAAAFEKEVMKHCPNCGRTFLEDRLPVHLRSCKPDKPHKPVKKEVQEEEYKVIPSKPTGSTYSNGFYNANARQDVGNSEQDRVECYKCGRKFASDRVQKHVSVCKGNTEKPKPMKVQSSSPDRKQKRNGEVPEWKKRHLDLINNIRYAKKIQQVQEEGGDIRSIEAPKQLINLTEEYKQCPYCSRRFNPDVADRHIPRCKDIINKPAPPPNIRSTGFTETHSPVPRSKSTNKQVPEKATCPNCSRQMPAKSLNSHLVNCRPPTNMRSSLVLQPARNQTERADKNRVSQVLRPSGEEVIRSNPSKSTAKFAASPFLTPDLSKSAKPNYLNPHKSSPVRPRPEARPSLSVKGLSKTPEVPSKANLAAKQSCFCHMCGEKYIQSAQFCAYCGTRKI